MSVSGTVVPSAAGAEGAIAGAACALWVPGISVFRDLSAGVEQAGEVSRLNSASLYTGSVPPRSAPPRGLSSTPARNAQACRSGLVSAGSVNATYMETDLHLGILESASMQAFKELHGSSCANLAYQSTAASSDAGGSADFDSAVHGSRSRELSPLRGGDMLNTTGAVLHAGVGSATSSPQHGKIARGASLERGSPPPRRAL